MTDALRAAAERLVAGFEHVSGIARQWEPDHSSGADRAKWARATEACADVARLLAAPVAPAEHTEQWWLHRIDMEKTAAWQQGYAQGLHRATVAPAVPAEPYLYVYEYDSQAFGVHRSFYPHEWNGLKPCRAVPLYAAPQPTAPSLDAIRAADRGMRAEDAPKLGMSMFASRADYAATAEESSAVGVPSAEPPAIPTGDVTESSFGEWQEASK